MRDGRSRTTVNGTRAVRALTPRAGESRISPNPTRVLADPRSGGTPMARRLRTNIVRSRGRMLRLEEHAERDEGVG